MFDFFFDSRGTGCPYKARNSFLCSHLSAADFWRREPILHSCVQFNITFLSVIRFSKGSPLFRFMISVLFTSFWLKCWFIKNPERCFMCAVRFVLRWSSDKRWLHVELSIPETSRTHRNITLQTLLHDSLGVELSWNCVYTRKGTVPRGRVCFSEEFSWLRADGQTSTEIGLLRDSESPQPSSTVGPYVLPAPAGGHLQPAPHNCGCCVSRIATNVSPNWLANRNRQWKKYGCVVWKKEPACYTRRKEKLRVIRIGGVLIK